jgi:hypothetical protein
VQGLVQPLLLGGDLGQQVSSGGVARSSCRWSCRDRPSHPCAGSLGTPPDADRCNQDHTPPG